MKHPFLTDEKMAALLKEVGQEAFIGGRMWERCTGRTTAAVLKALLEATENPNKWVLVDSADDYKNQNVTDYLYHLTVELACPLDKTRVYRGHLRGTPPNQLHKQWPSHMAGESYVWVRFGDNV